MSDSELSPEPISPQDVLQHDMNMIARIALKSGGVTEVWAGVEEFILHNASLAEFGASLGAGFITGAAFAWLGNSENRHDAAQWLRRHRPIRRAMITHSEEADLGGSKPDEFGDYFSDS